MARRHKLWQSSLESVRTIKRCAAGLTFCATLLVGGCGGSSDADGGGVADSSDGGSRTFNGIVVEAGGELAGANLAGADLSRSNRTTADFTGATMPDGTKNP